MAEQMDLTPVEWVAKEISVHIRNYGTIPIHKLIETISEGKEYEQKYLFNEIDNAILEFIHNAKINSTDPNGGLTRYEHFIQELYNRKERASNLLSDKVFHLANKLALAGYGNEAVKMHSIHNQLTK